MDASRKRLFQDGLLGGFLGYLAVVLFFAAWNATHGLSPFHTAALLGEAVFSDLRDPLAVTLDPGVILAFNGIHLLAFLGFGYLAAWLVYETELHPDFWYLTFFALLVAALVGYGALVAFTSLTGSLLSPWLVVGSAAVGAAALGGYLVASHRTLIRAASRGDADGEPGMAGHG